MLRKDAIQASGVVLETLPDEAFRVELPNGHRLVARMRSSLKLNFMQVAAGDRVTVELSPYDLSRGMIVLKER